MNRPTFFHTRRFLFAALLLAAALPFAAQASDGSIQPISRTEGSSQVMAAAAGGYHTCGVKADGSVACWGYNGYGQTTATAGAFLSVSAGYQHNCGVKADGGVACWGHNGYGQTSGPAGAFLSVSAGYQHSCGVKTDGNVACWGDNYFGQSTAPSGAFLLSLIHI